jgi:cell division septation protein DedD
MIKFLIITFNAVLFFFIGLFTKTDGISITGNFPATMKPGTETQIELKVKKGGMGGFAKLQLDLPEGFTATEAESKGANFSYADGIVKWVWPALPTEDEFVVRFNLKAGAGMNGVKTIGGKFSYVENNAKQVVEMAPADINISNEEGQVAANTPTPETKATETTTTAPTPTETKTTEPVAANTQTQQAAPTPTQAPESGSLNDEPPGNVTVTRQIKPGSNPNEHIVELTINKGNVKGFAKQSDDLPAGYSAKAIQTSESSFSVADGKIKFVWVNIPSKEVITISYLLSGTSNALVVLKGEFSYLANDQSKKFVVADATLPNTPSSQETVQTAPTPTQATEPVKEPVVQTPTTAPTPTEQVKTDTSTESSSDSGSKTAAGTINYRVQIGAFNSSNVTSQTLSRKFGIRDRIISEMHNNMNKFMVGSHNEYKNARDHREQVKSSVNSAFVVAYNGAKRITVQEALMLTNQKWFK